jgi:2'-5' RNA ligase
MSALTAIGVLLAIPEPHGGELRLRRTGYGDPQAAAVPTHVTLLPPTEVDHSALPDIERHLASVAERTRPFRIRLRGTGTFRPVSQVVFVRVERGLTHCLRLEAQVRAGVLDRDLQFPYHPHVTVAHDLDQAMLDKAQQELADYEAEFEIAGFGLYHRGPGAAWCTLRSFAFPAGIRAAA